MMRHKAVFKVIFIITALCIGKSSEADDFCMWCDDIVSERFLDCLTRGMANIPNLNASASSLQEMKADLLNASKAMKNNGQLKENIMKGALAVSMATLMDAAKNPDATLSYIYSILIQCYQILNKSPDINYIGELISIIKDVLKEKINSLNVQQPRDETQLYDISQTRQNIRPPQKNNYSPKPVATDSNQEKDQLSYLYGKMQQQRLNFQSNPSQGKSNNFDMSPLNSPYGIFQQLPSYGYLDSANVNQPLNMLYNYNAGLAYQNANQKYHYYGYGDRNQSPNNKVGRYDDKSPSTWLFQYQKKQPNTNDNNDKSPYNKAISYDELLKNKDDQSNVDYKTDFSDYNSNNQSLNDKLVNIEQKKSDQSSDKSADTYTEDDNDYGYYDYNNDCKNVSGGDNNINSTDDLGFSKKKQNPGTLAPDTPLDTDFDFYDYYDYKNDDDGGNGKDDSWKSNDGDSNYYPRDYPGFSEKKQSLTNDSSVNDKSPKATTKPEFDTFSLKDVFKNNKQEDEYPDIFNASGNDSKTIPKSKELEQQKNKSTLLYLSEFDNDGGQKLTTPMPSTANDQQTSTLADIDQKTSTTPIIPNTLKGNAKQTVLSTVAPAILPNISDNNQKLNLKSVNSSESDDRIKILTKWALDCMKDGKFNYTNYIRVIVDLVKSFQQTHPGSNLQKTQTMVLDETIFALTQLLLKSNVTKVKGTIQQPQKTVDPVKLPTSIQQSSEKMPQKYQIPQANNSSQPGMQYRPSVDYSTSKQIIENPPQNENLQNKWITNQNLNPNQGRWSNVQSRAKASSTAPQIAAQRLSWNTSYKEGQNNIPQINYPNPRQSGQQPLILGQVSTGKRNGKWGRTTVPITPNLSSNVGVPDINNNFRESWRNQAVFSDPQQESLSNGNRNQGSWSTQSGATSSSVQTRNLGF